MKAISLAILVLCVGWTAGGSFGQRTEKPVLHGRHWVAITGKPLGATAGAMIFLKGGNAVDAACAMLGAVCTMYDVLSWGGETQALIYNPKTGKAIGVNALGVAPTGATAAFFRDKGMKYPPAYGPSRAVTPGTPGGLLVMLADYGTMSLKDVLQPAVDMADGYPIEEEIVRTIEREKERIKQWPYSKKSSCRISERNGKRRSRGEYSVSRSWRRRSGCWSRRNSRRWLPGKAAGKPSWPPTTAFTRAISPANSPAAARKEGLITAEDLANWKLHFEEPVVTNYKGIDVCKLTSWVQGPVMLQALNMLEKIDLRAMGFNSANIFMPSTRS